MTIEITANLREVTEEVETETGSQTTTYQVAEPSEPIDYARAKSVRSENLTYYVEY